MGNTQSAEAPRRPPTKLTKPRTNTSTTNLLASATSASRRSSNLDLLAVPNRRSSTLSIDAVLNGNETAAKGKSVNRSKRLSLFRSKSAQVVPTARTEEAESDIEVNMSPHTSLRYNSLGSMRVEMPIDVPADAQYGTGAIRPPMRNTRTAPIHFPPSQSATRLSLVVEAQSPEPDPQEDTKRLGVGSENCDEWLQDDTLARTERSNSVQSIPIPIRRRSLLTPGIATRESSKDDPIRKPSPQQPSSPVTDDGSSGRMTKRYSFRKSLPAESMPSSPTIDDNSSGWTGKRYSFRKSLPAQSTSSNDQLRQYYYDQSKSTSSPLEELAALEVEPTRDSRPRTATPSELDYSHIGAFKLGSLRITNGAASPVPSGKTRYFDAKTPTHEDSEETFHTPSRLRSQIEAYPGDSNGDTYSCASPQKTYERRSDKSVKSPKEPPKIVDTMVEIPGFSLELADFEPENACANDIRSTSASGAYDMAQSYIQEIASSPFSFDESPPPTPQLQSTSKNTAMEDNLFDDEPEISTSLFAPAPLRPYLPLTQDATAAPVSITSLLVPGAEGKLSQLSRPKLAQNPKEPVPRPLEKADSGYSSKTSLRSTRSHKSFHEIEPSAMAPAAPRIPNAPAVPDKNPPPTPPKNLYTRYSDGMSIASSTVRGVSSPDIEYAPGTPTKEWLSKSPFGPIKISDALPQPFPSELSPLEELPQPPNRQAPPVPTKQTSPLELSRAKPPPLPIKSIEQTRAAALAQLESKPDVSAVRKQPVPTRRQSMPAPAETVRPKLKTSESDASISSVNRRLQKRGGPAPQTSLIVQGFTEIESATIPPISQDVEDHLEERLKNFPLLTHTYKTVHRTNSKETLATILSISPCEQYDDEVARFSRFEGQLPVAPLDEDVEESFANESGRMHQRSTERFSNVRNMFRRSTDQDRNRRVSVDSKGRNRSFSKDELPEINMKDFRAVTESLGASHYDFASPNLATRSPKSSQDYSSSNNKSNKTVPRSRKIGMDDDSAAQLARERSRVREQERQLALPRQQSYEDFIYFDGRGEYVGRTPVATLSDEEAPPLPTFPIEGIKSKYMPKKTKSPPPVSMNSQKHRLAIPSQQPSREAPSPRTNPSSESEILQNDIRTLDQSMESQWQEQGRLWQERRQSARNSVQQRFASRKQADPSQPVHNRPSLEPLQRPSISLETSHLFEENPHYQPQIALQSHSRSYQDQCRAALRQSLDYNPPQPQARSLARASFDSSITNKGKISHPLSHSQSSSQIMGQPLILDRYNGGLAYGYEPGYGIGGSAGMRNGETGASRKSVETSLRWGVDFSDVPIIVAKRREELEI